MRKTLLIGSSLFLLLFATLLLRRQMNGMHATEEPGLWANTRVLDLGYARSSGALHGKFLLRNSGSEKLRFIQATPECTCTVTDSPPRDLTPGETMALPVSLQVSTRSDAVISKRIGVKISRNGVESTIEFRVVARVDNQRFVMAFPSRIDFGDVEPGTPVSRSIYLRGRSGQIDSLPDEVQISSNEPIHIKPVSISEEDKLEYKKMNIILRVNGSTSILSSIVIDTSDKNAGPLIIPVRAKLRLE